MDRPALHFVISLKVVNCKALLQKCATLKPHQYCTHTCTSVPTLINCGLTGKTPFQISTIDALRAIDQYQFGLYSTVLHQQLITATIAQPVHVNLY